MGRLRKKPWADDYLFESKLVVNNPKEMIENWNEKVFGNNNEIWVEVGMGKGGFTIQQAKNNNDKNIVGVEKFASVQVVPVKLAEEQEIENLKFISDDATEITEWFKKDSVEKMFINFPDPWPKERHAKRRLLYKDFLNKFYEILKPGSWIEFKTDQLPLFEFALEQAGEFTKFEIVNETRDLHSVKDNVIMTEYEKRFTEMGNPIYYVEFHKVVK